MEDTENQLYLGRLTRILKDPKDVETSSGNITDIPNLDEVEGIDPGCIHTIKNRLVRIQYPGIVENVDKALETLGGMSSIENAVASATNKLTLNLHSENKFIKGCVADCDSNNGLLLKIKKQTPRNGPAKLSYEIVGVTVRNFVFNKLIDFQYLPLVAKYPESSNSEVSYIYRSILPTKLPSLESIFNEDKANMPLFLPPVGFSRTDLQRKLNPIENQSVDNVQPKYNLSKKYSRKQCMAFIKQEKPSIFHKYSEPEIPKRPTEFITQLISRRNYHDHLIKLQRFFEERPIWTRNGVKYNTNISNDLLKVLLPAVAYYENTGPWRCTWIRFGYDPRKDPEARKFQNLDYRIPNPIRSNLLTRSKRCVLGETEATSLKRLQAVDNRSNKSCQESNYILRPNMLPPTRQVFYQYCDILLPEIQTMLARLPPVPVHTQCDPKNGWLPTSFVEQCREIVNMYIDQQASNELLKRGQDQSNTVPSRIKKEPKSTDYCSLMIRNVKRGLYKEVNPLNVKIEAGPSTSHGTVETSSITEILDTDSDESMSGDENFYQEQDLEEIESELENTDGDMLISPERDSMNIDTDALEDVKNIIAKANLDRGSN